MAAGKNDGKSGLGHGGPGEQDDPAAPAPGDGVMGSQSGRPGHQPAKEGGPPAAHPAQPLAPGESARGTSETERIAGTPDDRATTDWQHGEGEPRPDTAPAAPTRGSKT